METEEYMQLSGTTLNHFHLPVHIRISPKEHGLGNAFDLKISCNLQTQCET